MAGSEPLSKLWPVSSGRNEQDLPKRLRSRSSRWRQSSPLCTRPPQRRRQKAV